MIPAILAALVLLVSDHRHEPFEQRRAMGARRRLSQ